MAISLMRLCESAEKKYNMSLVAGQKGMSNVVRWVHMVEDSQVPDFLHGNELVFTTGIGHFGNDWLTEFVKSLYEHNAAGLVVNLGPHIENIPSQAIVFCEQHDFPLFILPWSIHIIDITYDFCRRIIANEKTEMSIAEAFRNLIFSPEKKEGYSAALTKYGFFEDSSYTVIALSFIKEGREIAGKISSSSHLSVWKILKHSPKPVAIFSQDNALICVRQNEEIEEIPLIYKALERACGALGDIKVKMGISTIGSGTLSVISSYKEAVSSLTVAKLQNKSPVNYSDVGVYKLLLAVENRGILKDFCDSMLGELNKYEADGLDYCGTLRTYLKFNGSVKHMAEEMGVHRNTINYKIRTIKKILGTELTDEEKVGYQIAFYAKDILNL